LFFCIRRTEHLAASAFLAAAHATLTLQDAILINTQRHHDTTLDAALAAWSAWSGAAALTGPEAAKQKLWDKAVITAQFSQLLESTADARNRARLLAVSAEHSSDWLHALPLTSCGLRLDDDCIRVAVGLRLGASICLSHNCPCGNEVDAQGSHFLSCKRSASRTIRHAYINDIIHRSLNRAGIPASKEPGGLFHTDGKRPDGMSLVPWKSGKCLAWDVTVTDTTAVSYLNLTSVEAASAANRASVCKNVKYEELMQTFIFEPVAVETFGSIGSSTVSFLQDLGRRLAAYTGDMRESSYLFQRISMAI
jgi:hypothetical protein